MDDYDALHKRLMEMLDRAHAAEREIPELEIQLKGVRESGHELVKANDLLVARVQELEKELTTTKNRMSILQDNAAQLEEDKQNDIPGNRWGSK